MKEEDFVRIITYKTNIIRDNATSLLKKYQTKEQYEQFLKDTLHLLEEEKPFFILDDSYKGKVYTVFGCTGDRDRTKRPRMGEVSTRIADYTIITTDNPRTEKPADIIAEIEVGISKTKGKYEIVVIDSEHFTIRWAKSQIDSKEEWLEKHFEIPNGDPQ